MLVGTVARCFVGWQREWLDCEKAVWWAREAWRYRGVERRVVAYRRGHRYCGSGRRVWDVVLEKSGTQMVFGRYRGRDLKTWSSDF